MDLFLLVMRILPLLPGGINFSTTSGGRVSALSNTMNHSSWRKDIHWRTDSTEPSIPEHCAAGREDMPLRDIFMLSSEEASTQNICEKLTRNKSSVIDEKIRSLLGRHSLHELETNLGLSNPSHSPEKA
jgi:hypothetical protein